MRDPGLDEAIRAAGGVGALARKIGISQPSVSNWARIPAERVLSVEAATGVSRGALRPDLYEEHAGSPATSTRSMPRARRNMRCCRCCWRARPIAALLERLATLRGDASPLGLAHAALAEAASRTNVERVEREYFNLFIGLGRGELLPYGSYYLTGFLHERPLARLREDLGRLGIERVDGSGRARGSCGDPVRDHGGAGEPPLPGRRPAPIASCFEQHLAPWIGRFFADLERAEAADFYRRVGTLGRVFIEIETEAFALPS